MSWDVYFTEVAEAWILGLDDRDYEAIIAAIELLEEQRPTLGRTDGRPSIASRARVITT